MSTAQELVLKTQELPQGLAVLASLPEDLDLIPSTRMVPYNSPSL